jgi:Ni/Co efflux regulator RcnB
MKLAAIISTVLAVSLSTPGFAYAQGHQDRQEGPSDRGSEQQRRPAGAEQHGDRGAGPNHAFRKGDRLPKAQHAKKYVVSDWRGHHLSQPPRGYHWVQTGGDYVLVAIATGVILQLLLNNN